MFLYLVIERSEESLACMQKQELGEEFPPRSDSGSSDAQMTV
jgi:hypothetical protein